MEDGQGESGTLIIVILRNFLGAVLAAPTLFSHPLLLRRQLRLPSQEHQWMGDSKGASALRVGNARAWDPVVWHM